MLISLKAKSSLYDLFLIAAMLGWSLKSSSVKLKAETCIFGLTKKWLNTALGLDISYTCKLSKKIMKKKLKGLSVIFSLQTVFCYQFVE